MVAEHVENAVVAAVAAAPDAAAFVVAGGGRSLPLVDAGDVHRRHAAHGSFDPVAIRIVQECGQTSRALFHFGQAVFVVEHQGVRRPGDGSRRLVAVAVVP